MPTPAEILSWGRIDPYYVWAEHSGFAEDTGLQEPWLAFVVGCASPQAAADLRDKLQAEFGGPAESHLRFACPLAHAGGSCFTLQVKRDGAAALLQFLCGAGARWELGLPPLEPTALPLAMPDPPRPVSSRQVVGFIDFGCAFAHRQFRAWSEGKATLGSRVFALWDQPGDDANTAPAARGGLDAPAWLRPSDFGYGREWHREAGNGLGIDAWMRQFAHDGAIDEERCYRYSGYRGVDQPELHGTFVMDLAVGHPAPLPGAAGGAAPDHDIVFVQLPRMRMRGKPVTWLLRAHLLDAVAYIFACAKPTQPVTVNLSYGSHAGPHDGSTVLECALDELIGARRAQGGPTDLLVAAGNGGNTDGEDLDTRARIHAQVQLPAGGAGVALAWHNLPDTPVDQFTEVWFEADGADCELRFAPPGGSLADAPWVAAGECRTLEIGGQPVAMVVAPGEVSQSPARRMVLFAVAPTATGTGRPAAPYGRWMLELRNRRPGGSPERVHAWIERNDPVSAADEPRQPHFERIAASRHDTLNSLGHGDLPVIVGGYIGVNHRVPDYCSRGMQRHAPGGARLPSVVSRGQGVIRKCGPEWLAPCEESAADPGIAGAAPMGRDQVRRPGTSAACAVATRYVVQQRAERVVGKLQPPPVRGTGEWRLPRVV